MLPMLLPLLLLLLLLLLCIDIPDAGPPTLLCSRRAGKGAWQRDLHNASAGGGVPPSLPPLQSTRGVLEHPHCVYAACIDEVPVVECLAGEATKSGE